MLLLKTKDFGDFGDYKSIKLLMKEKNLKKIEIYQTDYCFLKVEDFRILNFKEIELLSSCDNLEKMNYQLNLRRLIK